MTNDGSNDATAAKVTDSLPAGLVFQSSSATAGSYDDTTGVWTIGDLADGASGTLTITAYIISGDDDDVCVDIINTAEASSELDDPDTDNNTASATISVGDECGDDDGDD